MVSTDDSDEHDLIIDPALWEIAAELVSKEGEFTLEALSDNDDLEVDVEAHSEDLEKSFTALEELGWLKRVTESPPTWEKGWKAQLFSIPEGCQ